MDTLFTFLEIVGCIVGLLYLWLEYRASIYLWITGMVMPALYVFVYFKAGLYADFAINIYFILAAIYGWMEWIRGGKKGLCAKSSQTADGSVEVEDKGIKSIFAESPHLISLLILIAIILYLAIAMVLVHLTDSEVPYSNAFNVSLSIVAMWMLAKKYIEQWWVWIVADVASAILYIHTELFFTAALYALYSVIAVFGYFKWRKMMNSKTVSAI